MIDGLFPTEPDAELAAWLASQATAFTTCYFCRNADALPTTAVSGYDVCPLCVDQARAEGPADGPTALSRSAR